MTMPARGSDGRFIENDLSSVQHGTEWGYRKHSRDGDEPCDPCRQAWAERARRYRMNRPQLSAKKRREQQAKRTAINQLARNHSAELRQLYLAALNHTDVPVAGPRRGNPQ